MVEEENISDIRRISRERELEVVLVEGSDIVGWAWAALKYRGGEIGVGVEDFKW